MGVRILGDNHGWPTMAALYCSTSEFAFGPIFHDDKEHTAEERAQAFLEWLVTDARSFDDAELAKKYCEWRAQEEEYWKAKEPVDEEEN